MLTPYMSTEVILPLDPLIPNSLASADWTIVALLKMHHLMMTGQVLLPPKREWPSAASFITKIALQERILECGLRWRGRRRYRGRSRVLRRRKRNYKFVRGKDRMLARVERDV